MAQGFSGPVLLNGTFFTNLPKLALLDVVLDRVLLIDPSQFDPGYSPGTAAREVLLDVNGSSIIDRKSEQSNPAPLQLLQVRANTIRLRFQARRVQEVGHTLQCEDSVLYSNLL